MEVTVPGIDDEWTRIMGNPDNVIMSDELEDRLSPLDMNPSPNLDVRLDPTCEFVFKDYSISGDLFAFAGTASDGMSSYTFSVPTVDACKLLNPSTLESYRIYIASEERDIMRTAVVPTTEVDVLIQWQETTNTVVTLTFKAWAK
jgi:hypothetical protein